MLIQGPFGKIKISKNLNCDVKKNLTCFLNSLTNRLDIFIYLNRDKKIISSKIIKLPFYPSYRIDTFIEIDFIEINVFFNKILNDTIILRNDNENCIIKYNIETNRFVCFYI